MQFSIQITGEYTAYEGKKLDGVRVRLEVSHRERFTPVIEKLTGNPEALEEVKRVTGTPLFFLDLGLGIERVK